ncbi:MAG: GPW/gp25 family protein [Bacteroidetes bacterium]|nr:MAG: GPW/gp25 family protein [Bacteroidota bacterium]
MNTFLGRGWTFPPAFFKHAAGGNAGVHLAQGEEDINQSLEILFSTALGERVMQPQYGGDLQDLMFEGMDIGLLTRLKDRVRKAIIYFEPRIKLDNVKTLVTETEGLIMLVVEYTVISTNTRNNMVYPFYLKEATDI